MSCPFARSSVGAAVCPFARPGAALPPGHPPLPPPEPLQTFTLDQLRTAMTIRFRVAVKGCVFDVSDDPRFKIGGQWHAAVGRDMTRTLAFARFQEEAPVAPPPPAISSDGWMHIVAAVAPPDSALHLEPEHQGANALQGLSFDELRLLETWYKHFESRYELVGRLLTDHELTATTAADELALPGEAQMPPMPGDIYGLFMPRLEANVASPAQVAGEANPAPKSLHALMDADEQEASFALVQSLDSSSPLVNQACHRSGMTPLQKAIEKGWLDVLRALLSKNADTAAPCPLYDNEGALRLAQRFGFAEAVELLSPSA